MYLEGSKKPLCHEKLPSYICSAASASGHLTALLSTCAIVNLSRSTVASTSLTRLTNPRICSPRHVCMAQQALSRQAGYVRLRASANSVLLRSLQAPHTRTASAELQTSRKGGRASVSQSILRTFLATAPAATRPIVSLAEERPPPATALMPYLMSYVASAWEGR